MSRGADRIRHCGRDAGADFRRFSNVLGSRGECRPLSHVAAETMRTTITARRIANAGQSDFPVLLVDSEAVVTQETVGSLESPRQLGTAA